MAYDIRRDRVGRGTVWYARSRKIRCRELIALLAQNLPYVLILTSPFPSESPMSLSI